MCDDLPLPESVDPHAGAEEKENLEALSRVSKEYANLNPSQQLTKKNCAEFMPNGKTTLPSVLPPGLAK